MELENTYENAKELVECRSGRAGDNGESLKPECRVQPMELAQRNLSLRVIYVLLGVSILLSVVAIITAVMLTIKNSEQTLGSIAKIQDEISQLTKRNHEMTLSTFAKLQDEISQLNKSSSVQAISDRVLRILKWKGEQPEIVVQFDASAIAIKSSEQTLSSIDKIQDEISQLSKNTTTLIAGLKNELFQCKSNVVVNFTKTGRSITELEDDILQRSNILLRCPKEWTRFRESCYSFSSSTKTWDDAQRHCELLDAHLVVINNAEEQEFLINTLQSRYWIGLSDAASEGDWRWVDGTDYSSSSSNWSKGEPNDEKNAEDCVETFDNGKWNDLPCVTSQSWICERAALIASTI
ncbi:C-type lectin domain family 4 member G-like isoform X2 [Hypanus sabinus]|uniref:C-type lectin domain family 4 member G-like isoform X2 n=1 Tax=Hypanus sabinus TaxID=79690 RepID=UPI0028C49F66|nr:C-type lectin domain family 4 member G-like isoform X2 [Hypanus sabinus]